MRNLKEAGVQICHLSASEPLVGSCGRARCPRPPKPHYLPVPRNGIEGRWAKTEATTLPGERPPNLGRCNCDTLSPKRDGDMPVMDRGSTDEAVVTVKLDADDAVAMQLRVKHPASGRKPEVKGGT